MSDLAKSLLDDTPELIEIRLYYHYKTNDAGVRIVRALDDEQAEKMLEDELQKNEVQSINTRWKQANWREQNQLLKSCQKTNPTTGLAEIEWAAYRDTRIKSMLVEWDLEDGGRPVPLNPEMIDRLPADIVLKLFDKYEEATGLDKEEEEKL